ncbi:MAG TPA: sugar nucleotide-binding protein [Baekduia sp.]|uniref:SDR family oxidoreductase n=1 Tax=Baekduia sp. TaxID=2600305 RepID=UPI002D76F624|nr:sugar nucleotide-binding protein [Baekduia sp.]HET6505502.1 sugar nucleotide-binding protein [Baekduia sp.]
MAKLLVTGASGFLGRALVAAASDDDVVTGLTSAVDVRDPDALRAAFARAAPEVVVHTAYVQSGPTAHAVNADGAGNVAAAARAAGARLVHVSTDAIFAGDGDRPLREEEPARPVTAYGATKAAAEPLVMAAHPDALMVRTSLIVGGPDHAPSPHEERAVAAARGELDLAFFTDEIRSPIAVDDLARALLDLAATDARGALHLGGPDAVSRLELARLVVVAAGLDPATLRGRPAPPDRPRFCPLDSSRALALLRVAPPRGVRELYASARGHRTC